MFFYYFGVIITLIGVGIFVYGWVMNIKLKLLDKHDKYDHVSFVGGIIMWIGILILSYIFLKPYFIEYILRYY